MVWLGLVFADATRAADTFSPNLVHPTAWLIEKRHIPWPLMGAFSMPMAVLVPVIITYSHKDGKPY